MSTASCTSFLSNIVQLYPADFVPVDVIGVRYDTLSPAERFIANSDEYLEFLADMRDDADSVGLFRSSYDLINWAHDAATELVSAKQEINKHGMKLAWIASPVQLTMNALLGQTGSPCQRVHAANAAFLRNQDICCEMIYLTVKLFHSAAGADTIRLIFSSANMLSRFSA